MEQDHSSKCWGKLISLTTKVPNVDLIFNEYILGRVNTNAIVVNDVRLSGKHAKITKESDGKVYLHDLSTNGTFFEDTKLGKNMKQELKPGSKFYLLYPSKVNQEDVIGFIYDSTGIDIPGGSSN